MKLKEKKVYDLKGMEVRLEVCKGFIKVTWFNRLKFLLLNRMTIYGLKVHSIERGEVRQEKR